MKYITQEIETHNCGECGILWGAPKDWWIARQNDGVGFYCPNGHVRVFRETEKDKLAKELSRARQQLAEKDDAIRYQREMRESAERSASAARGQITKLKKRAQAGVCPCCNRSFIGLQRHMANKHPGFSAEPIDGANVITLRKAP